MIRSSSVWGITDGSAGMVAQVRALAIALGIEITMKKVIVRKPYVFFPNFVHAIVCTQRLMPAFIDQENSDPLTPPWPDLVISCGRRSALVAMGMRCIRGCNAKLIHVQDPQVGSLLFDFVVAMEHDKITGSNVIKTRFALHAITPDILQTARQQFTPLFAPYNTPRIAVLIGGSTNKYTLTSSAMQQVITSLQCLLNNTGGSLLITPSRRTGEDNIRLLRDAFAGNPRVYIYDFTNDNPYLGLLACADSIITTNDSVNMMSEACATGKPLYLLPLPGHTNTKPSRFADRLIVDGIARPLGNSLEHWTYKVPDEMQTLSQEISKFI